jgi:hypothetical protein
MTEYIQVDAGGGKQRSVPVELPANSIKSKSGKTPPAAKRTEKVVTGTVVQKPQSLWKKAKASIIAGDVSDSDSSSIWQFVVLDVLIPAAKNMLTDTVSMMGDAISEGVRQALLGDNRIRAGSGRPAHISYNQVTRRSSAPEYRTFSSRARSQHDFNEVILASRGEAEEVLDRLRDLVSQYDVATVADFYDLVGVSGPFTGEKWGWYDLRSATIRHVHGGYLIALPRTQPIE